MDAQEAGRELERIRNEKQSLTPEIIVDESRPESAALHHCFDWDDETAAESWRKQQARHLVNSLVTVSTDGEEIPEPTRAYVHVSNEYRPVDVVIKTKDYKDEMLEQAKCDFEIYQRKYAVLEQLTDLFKIGNELFT